MKEELIKLASIKGFQQEVNNGVGIFYAGDIFENDKAYFLWLCLLQKWLREEHDIFVYPIPDLPYPHNSWKCILNYISPSKSKNIVKESIFPNWDRGVEEGGTFNQSLEKGLQQALKLVKVN